MPRELGTCWHNGEQYAKFVCSKTDRQTDREELNKRMGENLLQLGRKNVLQHRGISPEGVWHRLTIGDY